MTAAPRVGARAILPVLAADGHDLLVDGDARVDLGQDLRAAALVLSCRRRRPPVGARPAAPSCRLDRGAPGAEVAADRASEWPVARGMALSAIRAALPARHRRIPVGGRRRSAVQLNPRGDRGEDPVAAPSLPQAPRELGALLPRVLGVTSQPVVPKGGLRELERGGCRPQRLAGGEERAGELEHLVGELPACRHRGDYRRGGLSRRRDGGDDEASDDVGRQDDLRRARLSRSAAEPAGGERLLVTAEALAGGPLRVVRAAVVDVPHGRRTAWLATAVPASAGARRCGGRVHRRRLSGRVESVAPDSRPRETADLIREAPVTRVDELSPGQRSAQARWRAAQHLRAAARVAYESAAARGDSAATRVAARPSKYAEIDETILPVGVGQPSPYGSKRPILRLGNDDEIGYGMRRPDECFTAAVATVTQIPI